MSYFGVRFVVLNACRGNKLKSFFECYPVCALGWSGLSVPISRGNVNSGNASSIQELQTINTALPRHNIYAHALGHHWKK